MAIVLGSTPEDIEVVLTRNADFSCTLLTEDDSDWPDDVIIRLVLGSEDYDAVITGPEAVLNITDTEVNSIIAARVKSAKLMYIDGAADICWGLGPVIASG